MRLRIQTCPSAAGRLPALRVWFAIPEASNTFLLCSPIPGSSSSAPWAPQTTSGGARTIKDLKRTLCESLPGFKKLKLNPASIVLSMDGFELLDEGELFGGLVRDGDLVVVAYRAGDEDEEMGEIVETEKSMKRKRGAVESGKAKKTTKKRGKSPETSSDSDSDSSSSSSSSSVSSTSSTSSSSSSSSSASSSSSSSSDSSSESDSASDSDLSSSSSSSSAPSVQPIRKPLPPQTKGNNPFLKPPTKPKPAAQLKSRKQPIIPVPPGLGKPTTHSRNERRKKKRQALKDASSGITPQAQPPKGSSDANSIPLGGARASSSSVRDDREALSPMLVDDVGEGPSSLAASSSFVTSSEKKKNNDATQQADGDDHFPGFVMASLRNKNKKKGFFKQAMLDRMQGGPEQRKIKFGEDEGPEHDTIELAAQAIDEHDVQPTASTSTLPASQSTQSQRRRPRLIPPSELQDAGKLPSNIFVTSIDVEEGMPSYTKKNKKRRKKNHNWDEFGGEEEGYLEYEEGQFMDADATMGSEEQVVQLVYDDEPENAALKGSENFDWDKAEREWDKLGVVHDIAKLEQLGVGGHLAWKELSLNPATFSPEMMLNVGKVTSIGPDGSVTFHRLVKPVGENEIAAAFGLVSGDGEETLDEVAKWEEVKDSWRMISR
ncbi:hypothetical protein BKA70DRAFT_1409042 [Coprinopsis sp. MPI-PUGE-AT-0042]|nr:hypothetical protein BKA70DRAFT_1409042 [Coprinopsis sp. MPI-PUGE-AT-0042]